MLYLRRTGLYYRVVVLGGNAHQRKEAPRAYLSGILWQEESGTRHPETFDSMTTACVTGVASRTLHEKE